MEKQSYKNHVRYYAPHHFVFYPTMLVLTAINIICLLRYKDQWIIWLMFILVVFTTTWLSFMTRQHYALNNQNRIVRLEMRLRYYQLTHKRFEDVESKLSFKQVAALRFASDEELPLLVQNTLDKNLSPRAIKKSIVNWLPDEMRV